MQANVEVAEAARVARSSVVTVRRGVLRLAARLREERSRPALNGSKVAVLAHLLRYGNATAGELATARRLQPQSVTRTLAALEADGLIERTRDETDARRHLFTLTADGLAVLGDDMAQRDDWLAGAMNALSPAERAVLELAGELMDRLAAPEAAPEAPEAPRPQRP